MAKSLLLQEPNLLRFWLGQTGAFMAYNMLVVAVGWQVYDFTNSAFALGLVGLIQFLPQLLLTLVVGQVADRYDRRYISLACQWLKMAMAAVLAFGSWQHSLTVEGIFICAAAIGAARAFEMPAMQAMLPMLIPAASLPRAVAATAGGRELAVILGPALGGFIYAFGPDWVYLLGTAIFCLSGVAFIGIRSPGAVARIAGSTRMATLLGGISYIAARPVILGAISLDLFSVLLGGAVALLPIYARDILVTGPWGLGLLRAAPALGAIAMSLLLSRRPLQRRVGPTMMTAVAGFGLATIVFGLSRWFPLSMLALVCLGATDMISVVIRQSLVQLETPDEMRGRVAAVNSIFIGASNQLGEFESGATAALFGTVPAVVVGGLGTLVIVAMWLWLFPALARRDSLIQSEPGNIGL
ncbi:MAG TPA: MFS transporter [Dongiaceae bacterium]|nr:MFS transporter [Dongiaceae bacterium]